MRILFFLSIFGLLACESTTLTPAEVRLEQFIRTLPETEKPVFWHYRRIWLMVAEKFAEGDVPEHRDFDERFQYNIAQEKFLLRTMFTKDSSWNPYAIRCIDTLLILHYSEKGYLSSGLQHFFSHTQTDSGETKVSRYKGIVHYSNTAKYVKKERFSKYVHDLYPIPLMLDFTLPKRAKSFFTVDFDEVQVQDSMYNELYFNLMENFLWDSIPLIDTLKYNKVVSLSERLLLLHEYYRIVRMQQEASMPEEDWQYRAVRPVIDALIVLISKKQFKQITFWKNCGLHPVLIDYGLTNLANQWTNISPWLHHYITSGVETIAKNQEKPYHVIIKLPIGKRSIRRNSDSKPMIISPIKIVYQYQEKRPEEYWVSLRIGQNLGFDYCKVLKEKVY